MEVQQGAGGRDVIRAEGWVRTGRGRKEDGKRNVTGKRTIRGWETGWKENRKKTERLWEDDVKRLVVG